MVDLLRIPRMNADSFQASIVRVVNKLNELVEEINAIKAWQVVQAQASRAEGDTVRLQDGAKTSRGSAKKGGASPGTDPLRVETQVHTGLQTTGEGSNTSS